ncbi:MAG: hypothetical protein QGF67_12490 [Lentisphaeria bacterium]|nr:hypothetical protein [Lentisphaeria bacterium]MDP7742253.1 hypothetical protein [Lentisphaeria bacterium]
MQLYCVDEADAARRQTLAPALIPGRAHFASSHGGPAEVAKIAHTIASNPALASFETHAARPDDFNHGLFAWNIHRCHEVTTAYDGTHLVERLKRSRKNVVYVIGSVGFPASDERLQFDIVREFIARAHAEGIRVLTYLSLTNIFHVQVARHEPHLLERIQRHEDGSPFLYGQELEARHLACLVNNNAWIDNLKVKGGMAIEAGADGVFFDNVMHFCYCDECRAYFRDFSKQACGTELEFPAEDRMKATIRPMGEWTGDAETVAAGQRMAAAGEPIDVCELQRLCQYRIMADALLELRHDYLSQRPQFVFCLNNHMHTYINELGNYLWSQDPRVPGVLDDGRCYSNIPLYRYLQAQDEGWKPISAAGHRNAGDKELDLAEAAMFSISNYFLGDTPTEIRYEQFFSEHEALYTDVEPVTETAVLAHDILIQRFPLIPLSTRNVMFEIILRQQLDDDCLAGKKALILPEEKYLGDEMIRVIRRFVEQGGRLIVYGDAGMYRDDCVRRDHDPLAEVLGFSRDPWPEQPGPHSFGKGQAIFIPVNVMSGAPVPAAMSDAVQAFIGAGPVTVDDAPRVAVNLTRGIASGALHLHLLNYDCSRLENVRVHLGLPAAAGLEWAAYSPDGDECGQLIDDGDGVLRLPVMNIYTVLRGTRKEDDP